MAASKFLKLVSGVYSEAIALVSSSGASDADKVVATDSNGRLDPTLMPGGVPINASAGVIDAGKIAKLDSTGRFDVTMMPVGTDIEAMSVVTSENLASGNFVNVYSNAGVLTARKADATAAGKEANGFVIAASTSPAQNIVYFEGQAPGQTGLTVGTNYFLSAATPGTPVATPPNSSGNICQLLGKATAATALAFRFNPPVTIA